MGHITQYGIVSRYGLNVEDTPTEIVSKKRRKALFTRWADPNMPRSDKDERAAVARFFGGWEEGSGLLFDSDVWQRNIHVINPLWDDKSTPDNLTKWRVIDYAPRAGVNVCAWFAVGRKYAVMYRLLYERNVEIVEFAKMVIEASHNEQVFDEARPHEITGSVHKHYHENQCREVFYGGTLLDSRSMSQSLQGETLEEIYNRYGINDLRPASGQCDEIQIPRLKDWLKIDFTEEHPWHKDEAGKPRMGCPKLFLFDGRCDDFVFEIEGLQKALPGASGMLNKKDPHHAIDCAKYWASDSPSFMGDIEEEPEVEERRGNRWTGY